MTARRSGLSGKIQILKQKFLGTIENYSISVLKCRIDFACKFYFSCTIMPKTKSLRWYKATQFKYLVKKFWHSFWNNECSNFIWISNLVKVDRRAKSIRKLKRKLILKQSLDNLDHMKAQKFEALRRKGFCIFPAYINFWCNCFHEKFIYYDYTK